MGALALLLADRGGEGAVGGVAGNAVVAVADQPCAVGSIEPDAVAGHSRVTREYSGTATAREQAGGGVCRHFRLIEHEQDATPN